MLRVGLDLDGVCAEFSGHFLRYLNLGTTPAKSWDDPRFRENFHRIAKDEKFWLGIDPIIHGLQLRFNPVIYVTARPIANHISKQWLDKHDFPVAPVVTVGHGQSKVDALMEKVDVFLDDAIHNFEELNAAGIPCLLVTRSHNAGYDAGQFRVDSLMEFQNNLESNGNFYSFVFDGLSLSKNQPL